MYSEVKTIHDVGRSLKEIEKVLAGSSLLKRGELGVEAITEPREANLLRVKKQRLAQALAHVERFGHSPSISGVASEQQLALQLQEEIAALERDQRKQRRRRPVTAVPTSSPARVHRARSRRS